MLKALSRIYCARETRSWVRQRALSLAVMVGLAFVSLVVLVVMTGPDPGGIFASGLTIPIEVQRVWSISRWPVLLVIFSVVLTRFYAMVPCIRQRSRWITPGGLVASLLWMAASSALPAWVDGSESYARLYGPLGDVIVLMLWLYIAAFAPLVGAEINTAILAAWRPRASAPPATPSSHPSPRLEQAAH